jgi:hypothetical protein
MHKVAIILGQSAGYGYDDAYEPWIITKFTDFAEVDDETFQLLKQASHKYDFIVIETPVDPNKFICETVEQYKEWILAEKRKEEKARKDREMKALARKAKKKLASEEAERKLLEELQIKYGDAVK